MLCCDAEADATTVASADRRNSPEGRTHPQRPHRALSRRRRGPRQLHRIICWDHLIICWDHLGPIEVNDLATWRCPP